MNCNLEVVDLAGLIYSSGKVFNGLNTNRLDTEEFLRTGDTSKVHSRADLELLNDLRDAAQFILEHPSPRIDAQFVCDVNARLTRSAALEPGKLRNADQRIGVDTMFGRHEPPAITVDQLEALVATAHLPANPRERAMNLFIDIAKAQPFGDGNKRTALFVANSAVLWQPTPLMLTVPVSEHDPKVAATLNEAIARAYIHDDHRDVKALLTAAGFKTLPSTKSPLATNSRPRDIHTDQSAHTPRSQQRGPTLS